MSETPDTKAPIGGIPAFLGKVAAGAKEIGVRVFVHLLSLVCAGSVATYASVPPGLEASAAAGVYIGLICLVARGIRLTPEWLGPACLGLLQAIILFAAGFPLYQAVFWGGAQSWVQRLFAKRFSMGSEWVVLLFLLPLSIGLGGAAPALKVLIGSFAAIAFGGRALLRRVTRRWERRKAPLNGEAAQQPREEDLLAPFRASVIKLREKQPLLPFKIQPRVQAIAASAEDILNCMAQDSRDQEPGVRFLKRYLPAAHSVVDTHRRLSREKVITREMVEALAKSEEMLARLQSAFAKEHNHLLSNDIDDFSADLKVLDTLLKMDGR